MTPDDRELLQILRRQQMDLQRSLARLDVQLAELESRATVETELAPELPPAPPPLFVPRTEPPPAPSLPPPVPPFLVAATEPAALPPLPKPPPVPRPSFEFQFGRWLTRIGAVLFVLLLISADSYYHLHRLLGPWGKIGLGMALSMSLNLFGQRMERKNSGLLFYGRTLMAAGLAGLYVTLYAACTMEGLQVIRNPFLAGVLLLGWSAYVVYLAERKHSQGLALFAISLAFFSTAINPLGRFTMAADLVLAASSAFLLVRNGWAAFSYLGLIGTYLALLRRLVMDEDGHFTLETNRMIPFWPHAVYLMSAWFIFTSAVTMCASPSFRAGKRLAFLSLNNGALIGLLLLTAYIAGYGHGQLGWILLLTGMVFLATSRFVGWTQHDPERVMAAYAAQGLALVTAGFMVVFSGITRGFVLLVETFFLGMAGEFASDRILKGTTYVAGFFAALFLIWEIAVNAHHPWLLGFGGAVVMLLNAWWARSELRNSVHARSAVVLSSSYYCVLALGLIFTALSAKLSDEALPPALAVAALALTFLIYLVSIYELPALAQTFLIAAQAQVLFPEETGEDFPWWSTAWVAGITLLLLTWWTRQKITRTGSWTTVLTLVYALALAGLSYQTIRPFVSAEVWLVCASILSFAFLIWGAFTRVWVIAGVGQLFLAIAVCHFFVPPDGPSWHNLGWSPWSAAIPIAVVFATGRAAYRWTSFPPGFDDSMRDSLRAVATVYLLLALGMFIHWIMATVPPYHQIAIFLFLGTLFLSWNLRRSDVLGMRCGFVLDAVGLALYARLYLTGFQDDLLALATFANGLAFLAFLTQPALLRTAKGRLLTAWEDWALLLLSVGAGLSFVSLWVVLRDTASYLTLGWALYALFLFFFSLLTGERRLRWAGLAILCLAIIRVFACDLWGLSTGYRVLTLMVLVIITLGLGYFMLRFGKRQDAEASSPP